MLNQGFFHPFAQELFDVRFWIAKRNSRRLSCYDWV
jgi:hypothetical protein